MTFTVGGGWRGTQYEDFGFELFRLESARQELLSAPPFAGVVYSEVCGGAETQEIGSSAADFIGHITGRPGITARGEPIAVTIGGRTGLQVDVDAAEPGCVSDPPERLWLWDIGGVTDFHLNIGEAARIIALDGEGGVIVFVIETFDPATFGSPVGPRRLTTPR